jgi:hypothetical protein
MLSDIDTILLGPVPDRFTQAGHPGNAEVDYHDNDWYGPYSLGVKARSANAFISAGRWRFNTSSGGPSDWISAPGSEGLHEVLLHNVMHSGVQHELPFTTTVASAYLDPNTVFVRPGRCTPVKLVSGIELPGFEVNAFGLSKPMSFPDTPIEQDDPDDPTTASFKQDLTIGPNAIRFMVTVTDPAAANDFDLFVVLDGDGDGVFTEDEVVASSTTPSGDESVVAWSPPPGNYQIWLQGWSVPTPPAMANIEIEVIEGDRVYVDDLPPQVVPDEPYVFNVCLRDGDPVDADERGLLLLGPEDSPTLFIVNVLTPATQINLPSALMKGQIRNPAATP